MPPPYEIEKVMDSLATISSILFKRLHCMECNQCEPCGVYFMDALKVLENAGKVVGGHQTGSASTGD